jgi:hypothetical protein
VPIPRAFVDQAGTTRLEGFLDPDPGGAQLGLAHDQTNGITLLVTPNATIIGDASPGVLVQTGILFFAARVRNPNPSPHDLHFTGFPGGGTMDVTIRAGEDDTVCGVFAPFPSATYQVWGTDDNAADPGEVGCLVIVCQTASYFPLP